MDRSKYKDNQKNLYWTPELQAEVEKLAAEMKQMGIKVDQSGKMMTGTVILYALKVANRQEKAK